MKQTSTSAMSIRLPGHTADYLRQTAAYRGESMNSVIRRALGIMQALDAETQAGRYVGATRDRDTLETVLVAPL